MNDMLRLNLCQVKNALAKKEFSCVDLAKAYIAQGEKTQHLNAFVTRTNDHALRMATESDRKIASGDAGLLEGIPFAIKDAYCTKGVLTTASSKMLYNFVPEYESSVTSALWHHGAVMLGKTNLDEFCMGSTTTPEYTGASYNPWNTDCTAGGSSGGSAVAVASGAALCALGTDTGGSIRQPASFCGIVGVRPTYGRCSRWGVTAFSSSLDSPGPFARTVSDAALVLQAISGHDPKDATSLAMDVPCFDALIGQSIRGMRIGIPRDVYDQADLDPDVRAAWDKGLDIFKRAGCTVVPVSMPLNQHALSCYYVMTCAEAASNMARYDGVKYGFRADNISSLTDLYAKTRGQGFGAEVKRRIFIGTYVLSSGHYDAYYQKVQKLRQCIIHNFRQAFHDVDVFLTPTTPTPAFPLNSVGQDPVKMYLNDILTVPVNIGNTCAISVPCGLSSQGLPMGLQVIAPHLCEERLFQFGAVLENECSMPELPFCHGDNAS